MKLYIFPNLRTEMHIDLAVAVTRRLVELGNTCSMDPERCEKMYSDRRYVLFPPEEADMIVAIGGDGSVLRGAKLAVRFDIPLLGINSGRLGFLCALDAKDLNSWTPGTLESLVPSKRSLLSFELDGKEFSSLNDVIVAKENFGESMEMDVSFCKEGYRFCGDGVIVATPTGSTAYNLSAGGAVVHLDVPAFVVTPICPHEPGVRSKVIPQNACVEITLHRTGGRKAQVYSDGEYCGTVTESLRIRGSEKILTLLGSDK